MMQFVLEREYLVAFTVLCLYELRFPVWLKVHIKYAVLDLPM